MGQQRRRNLLESRPERLKNATNDGSEVFETSPCRAANWNVLEPNCRLEGL